MGLAQNLLRASTARRSLASHRAEKPQPRALKLFSCEARLKGSFRLQSITLAASNLASLAYSDRGVPSNVRDGAAG
jgi:hypothetical protein